MVPILVLVQGVSVDRDFSSIGKLKALAADPQNRLTLTKPEPATIGRILRVIDVACDNNVLPRTAPVVVTELGDAKTDGERFFRLAYVVDRPGNLTDPGEHLVILTGTDRALVDDTIRKLQ